MPKTLKLICTGAILLCLLGSFSKKKKPSYLRQLPPGTISIGENLFYDQTEIPNVCWREYEYWTKRVFGENSDEYKATIPDTLVWVKKDTCLSTYTYHYYRHPAHNSYPVVGISQKQAEQYCKWRAERVFERILINMGKLKENPKQGRQSHFTIEGYYAGQYQNVKPDVNFKYYPEYRLPTVQEWKLALHYEDSIEHVHKFKMPPPTCGMEPCPKGTGKLPPTRASVYDGQKNDAFYDLKGNVCEWSAEKGICVGGSWADPPEIVASKDTFQVSTPNAQTGFRCVCQWKEYKFTK